MGESLDLDKKKCNIRPDNKQTNKKLKKNYKEKDDRDRRPKSPD